MVWPVRKTTDIITTDSAGNTVEAVAVYATDVPVQDAAGRWVDPVAAEESDVGFPVRLVDAMIAEDSTGRPVDATPIRGVGPSYDSDAQAFFDRLPAQPSAARKALVNDMIVAAKDNGWWAETDALHLMAFGLGDPGDTTTDDATAALFNLRQDAYHLTAFNSPAFTTDRGYAGNGVSAYLSTNFNPTTAVAANFQRDDANFAIWSLTSATGVVSDAGYYGGANGVTLQCRDGTNNFTGRINQASVAASAGNTDGKGLYEVDRNAASGTGAIASRKNGAVVTTNTTSEVSTALLNASFQYLRYGTSSYSARQLAVGLIGGSLTPTQATARYNDILTYLQAVGAVV